MKTKITNMVLFTCSLVFLTWLTACDSSSNLTTTNPACGNSIVEEGEACDMGPAGDASCDASCTLVSISTICGNSILESGEVCEDGNALDGDGCSALCQFEAGSSVVDADGDGYTATIDCNDADAAIHQNAVDIAGDGIDQNCSGADNYVSQRDESVDLLADGSVDSTAVISYNASGKPTLVISDNNADGTADTQTSFAYTDSGKTSQWIMSTVSGTLILQFTFVYDENDQLTSMTIATTISSSTTTYANTYNANSQLTKTSIDSNADAVIDKCYSFAYDTDGHISSIRSLALPACTVVSVVYNTIDYENGVVTLVINSGASTPTQEVFNYNDAGLISQWLVSLSSDGSLSESKALTYDSSIAGVSTDVSQRGWTFFVDSSTILDNMYFRYFIPAITGIVDVNGAVTTNYTYVLTLAE